MIKPERIVLQTMEMNAQTQEKNTCKDILIIFIGKTMEQENNSQYHQNSWPSIKIIKHLYIQLFQ